MANPRRNGCHNQPRPTAGMPLTVQAGWTDENVMVNSREREACTRLPYMVQVPFAMTTDCQYTKTTPDKACEGCCHQIMQARS